MMLGRSMRRRRRGTNRRPPDATLSPPRLLVAGTGVAALGLLLGWLVATRLLFPTPDTLTGLVTVPDVQGRTLDQVEQLLAAAELDLGEVEAYRHPAADSGTVVAQSPLPGQLALPGAPVRISVSVGAERSAIPAVSRLVASQAFQVLRATGFAVAVDSAESELPRGQVVRIDPAEGTSLRLPAEVRMTVSLGPPSITLPILLGLSEIVARDSLEALGLRVGEVEEVFRFGRDQGRVVGQDPAGGTELERGTAIRLIVGRRGA